ncbi:hypothetical protein FDP41_011143 [Naegleria fowleri]|uniref:F-box domain-containing protein n=1 Tax=Naegleria fowleri TaxID=5763 RepID=A0A6A5CCV1_NAEFO|nr:uncharacterized protein FDP41_011143 [Naegleria fowleri]KAF0983165.1 hypothetical protein FDP41_011143 [Naegleria fowleri]
MFQKQISPSSYRWTQEKIKYLKALVVNDGGESGDNHQGNSSSINLSGRDWNAIARELNEKFGTAFSGQSCQDAMTRFQWIENLSSDMWALIFSFLNLNDLFGSVERVCKSWRFVLLSEDCDFTVYGVLVNEIAKFCGFSNATQICMIIQNEKSKTNRELVKEFYLQPLKKQIYTSEAFTTYLDKGGVIDIWMLRPCELLNILLKHQISPTDQGSYAMEMIHKYALMSSISGWHENEFISIAAEDTKRIITFNSYPQNPSPKISNLSHGILLREMMQHLKTWRARFGKKFLTFFQPINDCSSVEYDLMQEPTLVDTKSDTDTKEKDIFDLAGDPPYAMKDASHEISQLRSELFGEEYSCTVYEWKATMATNSDDEAEETWSTYWLSGMEWWGTYAFTIYNHEKRVFFVATASTSD